jgi:predicted RNase H-related nuclease YkuK (DUF458 family)
MFSEKQIEELINLLLALDDNTKVYIGTDSSRFKKDGEWFAKYASVCVVHLNGKNGCRVFKTRSVEKDYDLKENRPKMRMLNEVAKSCELYNQLAPYIDCYDIEIHLDINLDPKHGSSCAAKEAAGYVLGMTGVSEEQVKFKPDSFCASFGADHYINETK